MRAVIAMALLGGLITAGCATVKPVETQSVTVEPAVSPALAQAGERCLKKKVAIARFTNETLYGKSALLTEKADLVAKQASDMLSTRMAQTGKFVLFELPDAEQVLQGIAAGSLKEAKIPADYVVVGSVSEFGRKTTGETGVFSRTKRQVAYAKVNVRLVNVRTAQVVFATEGAGEAEMETGTVMGIGTKADYDATLNDKAISAAVSKVTSNLVEKLVQDPWRSYLLDIQGDQVVIAGGRAQGLAQGDRLTVVQKGKTVNNPQTNLPIELPGKNVATIEVVSSSGDDPFQEVSYCRLVEGSLDGVDVENFFIQESGK